MVYYIFPLFSNPSSSHHRPKQKNPPTNHTQKSSNHSSLHHVHQHHYHRHNNTSAYIFRPSITKSPLSDSQPPSRSRNRTCKRGILRARSQYTRFCGDGVDFFGFCGGLWGFCRLRGVCGLWKAMTPGSSASHRLSGMLQAGLPEHVTCMYI